MWWWLGGGLVLTIISVVGAICAHKVDTENARWLRPH